MTAQTPQAHYLELEASNETMSNSQILLPRVITDSLRKLGASTIERQSLSWVKGAHWHAKLAYTLSPYTFVENVAAEIAHLGLAVEQYNDREL